MTTATISTLVNEYAAAISALDIDRYLATFADDAVVYEPVGTPACQGKADIRQFFENIAGLFASNDMQFTFVQIIGDEVAIKWLVNGVGKNGVAVSFEGIDIWQLDRTGKIQTLRAYWHPEPVMAQLTSG
jgi:steroid Delta-isomerase